MGGRNVECFEICSTMQERMKENQECTNGDYYYPLQICHFKQIKFSDSNPNGGCDETPGDVMIHVVPEGSKSRWSHIEDLVSYTVI